MSKPLSIPWDPRCDYSEIVTSPPADHLSAGYYLFMFRLRSDHNGRSEKFLQNINGVKLQQSSGSNMNSINVYISAVWGMISHDDPHTLTRFMFSDLSFTTDWLYTCSCSSRDRSGFGLCSVTFSFFSSFQLKLLSQRSWQIKPGGFLTEHLQPLKLLFKTAFLWVCLRRSGSPSSDLSRLSLFYYMDQTY